MNEQSVKLIRPEFEVFAYTNEGIFEPYSL
jgi:hypothetical protein